MPGGVSRAFARLVALGLLCVAWPAQALEGRHALIVGIGEYSAASRTSTLHGIPKDVDNARRMALAIGVEPSAIIELRDSAATKPRILRELAALRERVRPGDRVLFYWAGHGARYPGRSGCVEGLQTWTAGDFTETDVMSESELASYLQPISQVADKVITVMDACFSGGVIRGMTRSAAGGSAGIEVPQARFNDRAQGRCDVGVNQPQTRSLLSELSRLGVRQENFVQIASASYNEVSWDTATYGGHATHSLTQCLLGEAKDLNGSGAVSLDEIRTCAQERMNRLIEPHKGLGMAASTLQVRGNRNLVVTPAPIVAPPSAPPVALVPVQTAPIVAPPPGAPAIEAPQVKPPVVTAPLALAPVAPPAVKPPPVTPPPPAALPPVAQPPVAQPPATPIAVAPPVAVEPAAPVGSRATLEDIFAQRDPRRTLDVSAPTRLTIGKDPLQFSVNSSVDGYLYAVMLGSDDKSFYLLFPNALDKDNRIRANQKYALPRPGWQVTAAGPAGTNRILFVVSPSPRDPGIFVPGNSTAGGVFTYSVADIASRQRLVDFFLGKGVKGRNASMGAALIDVEEVP